MTAMARSTLSPSSAPGICHISSKGPLHPPAGRL